MGKHTPEPWVISGACVAAESDQLNNGFYVAICKGQDQRENARRIVACVNACRGLPTDELEQKGLVAAVGTQLLDLEKQRDELLDVQKDHHRLVRELDVLLNGVDGAAPQASLCDLVAQLKAKGGAA